jgi:hypothetical protein
VRPQAPERKQLRKTRLFFKLFLHRRVPSRNGTHLAPENLRHVHHELLSSNRFCEAKHEVKNPVRMEGRPGDNPERGALHGAGLSKTEGTCRRRFARIPPTAMDRPSWLRCGRIDLARSTHRQQRDGTRYAKAQEESSVADPRRAGLRSGIGSRSEKAAANGPSSLESLNRGSTYSSSALPKDGGRRQTSWRRECSPAQIQGHFGRGHAKSWCEPL